MSSPALKQIRFVHTNNQPPTKRRRINAACRTCRRRKIRCDGNTPTCLTCTDNGHKCLGYAAETADINVKQPASKGGADHKDEFEDENNRRGSRSANGQISPMSGDSQSETYFPLSNETSVESEAEYINSNYRQDTALEQQSAADHTHSQNGNLKVPYFRYFGPTAIVPGFKQMVVSLRENRKNSTAGFSIPISPGSNLSGSNHEKHSPRTGSNSGTSAEMPFYEQSDSLPVNRLIIHLVDTFFNHLGCNFPFLCKDKFTQMVEDRTAETLLVDAVCALAARFSEHALLTAGQDYSYPKSDYGHGFAQRARAAVVDTFPRPSVSAVQACLLLAYESFGCSQDSALWMYLGCAIRMAVDLGLQKFEGVKYQGQKDPRYQRPSIGSGSDDTSPISNQEKEAFEQERIDTLWAVFMLDRVISSGVGRPVTLRDKEFEHFFPTPIIHNGRPNPFPALIQIIHLYGKVSDLLNNMKNVHEVTPKKIEGLSEMEKDLTTLYQKLDTRLTFNAENFQSYVKSGDSTNFILVHLWFHCVIVLMHHPQVRHSFDGEILQLLPNSHELSMSSAKTIADILAFAELIEPKSFLGNPFTSQPIYIAACAFLRECETHSTASQPTSRPASPPWHPSSPYQRRPQLLKGISSSKQKHSLLASVANQNYQRCYKALEQLKTYWAGASYILVVLDQKAKGIWDAETYTELEMASTKIRNEIVPAWRQKILAASPGSRFADLVRPPLDTASPGVDASQAIGWSLTGTTNSPSSNLTFMYQNLNGDHSDPPNPPSTSATGNMIYDPIRPDFKASNNSNSNYEQRRDRSLDRLGWARSQSMAPPAPPTSAPPPSKYVPISPDPPATADAEILLSLGSPSSQTSTSRGSLERSQSLNASPAPQTDSSIDFSQNPSDGYFPSNSTYASGGAGEVMMMTSQPIDMSDLGGEMGPWLDYLPQDILQFFDSPNTPSNDNNRINRPGD